MIKDKFNYDRKRGIDQLLVDLDNHIGSNAGASRVVFAYLKEKVRKLQAAFISRYSNCFFVTYF